MATIIISLILLVMTVEQGSSGWYSRFNILGTEAKEQATSLAEGCAEQAMAKLLTDPTYTGGATTTTSIGTCHIFPVQMNYPIAGLITIKTQAVVRDSYANLDMAMNMNDIHFGSIPSAPSTGTLFITTHVINDSSGSRSASDFTMSVSANPNGTFPGSESGTAFIVQPGTYSVSEVAVLPNYTKNVGSNCSGTITAGSIKFCTITYNDITTTLTLIANVVNDNGGTRLPTDFPLFIDGNPVALGTKTTVTAGSHTVNATNLSGYAVSPWGYDCTTTGTISITLGQNKTCIINFNDLPPPAPTCADTVMMLDRTGSMGSTDLAGERAAANALVSLYAGVLPPATPPQLSVGVFGDGTDNNGLAPARITQQLTTLYPLLTNSINSQLGSSEGYTNLSDAIRKASDELNSPRHIVNPPAPAIEKRKVIIIVSDGEPNRPNGSTLFDTGFKSPTTESQNSTGDLWNNPTLAYIDGGGDASDNVNENDRHQFGTFTLGSSNGLPSGSTIRGIEAKVDAWSTAGVTYIPGNISRAPSSNISPNNWVNPTRVSSSDNSYTTNSTNGNQQGFGNFGFNIPVNATITGVQVTTEAKINAVASTTGTIIPSSQGTYGDWDGGVSNISDIGNVSCSATSQSAYIDTNDNGDRETFNINISSIPNGSIITGVNVTVYDRAESNFSQGGTYRMMVRTGGTNYESVTQNANGTNCNVKTQTIDINDPIKTSGTNIEVGVIKVNGDNSAVRIDAIRATVTFIPATTGNLDIALSSNNGGNYTASKSVTLTGTETVLTPTGNSLTDMWGRAWTPADFNNGNFAVRVSNNSITGPTISLDQIIVNVLYTTPVSSGAACQIGVDLSWNGGASWTNEKTQNLNGSETTYTLGSSNDDWTSSRTWNPQDFSNANFRARVRSIDPGSGCDSTAVIHLDLLQLKVHYSHNVDPIEAALNSADTAKLSGIDIFTIHFGDDNGPYVGKDLLANLASGVTPITYSSGHQNGSFANGSGFTTGSSGPVSPTLNSADSGGDGNGFQTNASNAYSDGPSGINGAAQNVDGAGDRHRYFGYNFTIPPNATITGIQTRLDWWLNDNNGTNSMNVELSWNGGASWTTAKSDTNEPTNSSNSRTLGGTSDTWGRTWTANELTPANFRVRVGMNSSVSSRDFYLDWLPVTVSYSVNTENGDGDNFFVAPTSSDMQGIFNFIGEQVCPAALNLTATPPPTTGLLSVFTQVVNNNSGTRVPADFTVNVNATNPSPANFPGSSTGVNVTVDPGAFDVTENGVAGYIGVPGPSCSSTGSLGPIVAGENRVCIISNDDIPPPPPPPNLNFNTNSWLEIPTAN